MEEGRESGGHGSGKQTVAAERMELSFGNQGIRSIPAQETLCSLHAPHVE